MIPGSTPRHEISDPAAPARPAQAGGRLGRRAPYGLFFALGLAFLGCYRATGITRPMALASEIPATGGDRVHGLKAQAGPGDYFLGNDFVELAVDGSPFLPDLLVPTIAGAAGGGSIVDVGYVGLDTSYHRVSMPSDVLDRMTPVVNQDPDLQLVFDHFQAFNLTDESRIEMDGYLYDPLHKLAGAGWDSQNRVAGVAVHHIVHLGKSDKNFLLETTLTNGSGSTLPIRNIGDFVYQSSAAFRFMVPATEDAAGQPVAGWGVQIPGTSWATPLASAVKAQLVAMIGAEPGDITVDSHLSLGLLPIDADQLLVGCDAQDALTQDRPKGASRMVAGGLPVASLAPGQSLRHLRRLFVSGGTTISSNAPNQGTGLLNDMEFYKANTLHSYSTGVVAFNTFGTATKNGPLQSELRFERNVGTDAAPVWKLQRVEWQEPQENIYASVGAPAPIALLPTGTYRITSTNRLESTTMQAFTNVYVDPSNPANSSLSPDFATPLLVQKDRPFSISEYLAPERSDVINPDGQSVGEQRFTQHTIAVKQVGAADGMFQPLRFTVVGTNGSADPDIRRVRGLGGTYDPLSKAKVLIAANTSAYHFGGGNSLFGANFSTGPTVGGLWFPKGTYDVLGTRGPLSYLDRTPVQAYDGQTVNSHGYLVSASILPAGWTAFDLPGVSLATGGGCLPSELLASALAENVQVVAATELDIHIDPDILYSQFRMEFTYPGSTDDQRVAILGDPLVLAGRSASLTDLNGSSWGLATILSPPAATAGRSGGALPSKGWSLADFMTQEQGKYTVVHRPRGPQGLFTLKGFNPAVALGTGVNAWWTQTGAVSLGRTQGSFDALELLRADGFDPANPTAWFTEFKSVRQDWFALLNQQTPTNFTKGLGLSGAKFSQDTPVGLARTYLSIGTSALTQADLSPVLAALKSGAGVASTGPLLSVSLNGKGPGSLVTAGGSVTLLVDLYASDWSPVDELRVVVNGQVVKTVDPSTFAAGADWRQRTGSIQVTLPTGKDCWIVVEAGVPLATTGVYRAGSDWNRVQKGIYPIAVTNPIFVDVTGGGYTPPGL